MNNNGEYSRLRPHSGLSNTIVSVIIRLWRKEYRTQTNNNRRVQSKILALNVLQTTDTFSFYVLICFISVFVQNVWSYQEEERMVVVWLLGKRAAEPETRVWDSVLTFVNVKYVTPHIKTQCCNMKNRKFKQRKCKCLQIILSDWHTASGKDAALRV